MGDNVIVYSAVSGESEYGPPQIIRISLHRDLDSNRCSQGDKFRHRAAWDHVAYRDDFYASCRSPDVEDTFAIGDKSMSDAIAWLIEGESVSERESSKRDKRRKVKAP